MENPRYDKISKFLSDLSDIEFRYLRLCTQMANDARQVVLDHNLSKEQFCNEMCIDLADYNKYMRGGYEYSLKTMASLQALYVRLKTEEAAKEAKKFTGVIVKDPDEFSDNIAKREKNKST